MKAVVLLSGGLDSATTLYYAKKRGYKTHCLTFSYGQRHRREIESAKRLAKKSGSVLDILKLDLPWRGSSLTDRRLPLPKGKVNRKGVPSTYVPGRNIIFLSYATSYAEAIGAEKIFIGVNQIDYSGYPDCRESFLKSFQGALKSGTRHKAIRIEAPLINKAKAEIVKMALRLSVPIALTWSCYRGDKTPCGRCDSCLIRARGFKDAEVKDPLI